MVANFWFCGRCGGKMSKDVSARIEALKADYNDWCSCGSLECQKFVNYKKAQAKLKSLVDKVVVEVKLEALLKYKERLIGNG